MRAGRHVHTRTCTLVWLCVCVCVCVRLCAVPMSNLCIGGLEVLCKGFRGRLFLRYSIQGRRACLHSLHHIRGPSHGQQVALPVHLWRYKERGTVIMEVNGLPINSTVISLLWIKTF